jgi:hypothetical protein
MGKQSRLRALRRAERQEIARDLAPNRGEPLRILRSLHRTIQGHCHENGRRCWEYMVEMLAHVSGWPTESDESKHLWDKMQDEGRFVEFAHAWIAEVEWAKANGAPFSEPIGELLEEIEGHNESLGQFFTPMPVVRMINSVNLGDIPSPGPSGLPTCRGLDPCCGSGRFLIDALVHNDGIMMHGVDLDLWMVRAAMLNVRLLARWTSMSVADPDDRLKPLRRATKFLDQAMAALASPDEENPFLRLGTEPPQPKGEERVLIVGGRAVFIHGNSMIVDLDYTPNWACAGWSWKPHPWQWNLKMRDYYGSYEDWEKAGRPDLNKLHEQEQKSLQFDYSMAPPKR